MSANSAPVVVIADGNLRRYAERLEKALPPATEVRWLDGPDEESLRAALADAEVYVGGRFGAELAAAAPRLRLLQVPGAELDGVDFAALPDGLAVANAFRHEDAMAEHSLWAALGLRRGFVRADRELREHAWASPALDPAVPMPRGLRGATVGFLGFGHIGERAWRAFRSFGASGAAVTGRGRVDAGRHGLAWAGGTAELGRLCAWADVLLVSVPLSEATRGLVGHAELSALGPDGILINQARGPVVDEDALYAALREGRLGAAAIDVWYSYPGDPANTPPSRHRFGELPNVLLTPHFSGVAEATFLGRIDDIAANVAALAAGTPLRNRVR